MLFIYEWKMHEIQYLIKLLWLLSLSKSLLFIIILSWLSKLTVIIIITFISIIQINLKRQLVWQRRTSVVNWSAFSIHDFPSMTNGRRMFLQSVMELAICNVVCPFQMMIQCIIIWWEADCAFLLQFVPLRSSGLPTSNISILTIYFGKDKCFHISFDLIL